MPALLRISQLQLERLQSVPWNPRIEWSEGFSDLMDGIAQPALGSLKSTEGGRTIAGRRDERPRSHHEA
jgi:hypothetical protein